MMRGHALVMVALAMTLPALPMGAALPATAGGSPCDLVSSAGAACAVHYVSTNDGYQLGIGLVRGQGSRSAGAVMLQHGLMDSSDTWVLNGRQSSLALQLASEGYDVVLANSRGNQYSPVSDYGWSFDEMAQYDLSATIGWMKTFLGVPAVVYVGHSQGSAILFAALSQGWVDARDVALFVALAPPVQMANQRSLLFQTMADLGADAILKLLGGDAFTLSLSFVNSVLGTHYTDTYDMLKCLFGPSNNLDGSQWQGHFPCPTSSQNVAHWIQEARYGTFGRYKPHFWSSRQTYNLGDIAASAVPTAIYSGTNDYMADTEDCAWLARQVDARGNLVYDRSVQGYAHMDFTYALDAKSTLYGDVLDKISVYANHTTTRA